MADIRVVWDSDAMMGDWLFGGRLLDTTHELVTAVAVALFTDRTAESDDRLPDDAGDRRGWWADFEAGEIYSGATPIGSRLWLISREKHTEETRVRAEEYIREAIQPFVANRIISAFDLDVQWFALERLGAVLTLYRGALPSIEVRFRSLWDEIR